MSTQAAARQRTQDAVIAPLWSWTQIISSDDPFLICLCGARFQINNPTGNMPIPPPEFVGYTDTKPQHTFRGEYNSSQLTISFRLTHEERLYTFFGVISPVDGAMGGVILGNLLSQVPEGSEDEGSWSAQAPPREDDDSCPPRKTAATKRRR